MSNSQDTRSMQQNAELTFKLNREHGRHGWLRLTPAYSVKLVNEILRDSKPDSRVLDPFSGTATTPLCAAYAGNSAAAIDINPFLTWLGNAKLATYSPDCVRMAREGFLNLIGHASCKHSRSVPPPPMHNIQRWWNPEPLEFLCKFKAALDDASDLNGDSRDLLVVIFCRLIISFSNVAFNHQSMSFKDKTKAISTKSRQPLLFDVDGDLAIRAETEGHQILDSASDNPRGAASVLSGDSRHTSEVVADIYDLVITSPPYPNRMSYIRELRPYMYWLGYLSSGRDAGDMDWSAIGGTWGIATSRLGEWQPSSHGFYPRYFQQVLSRIQRADHKSGVVLSNYVAKYFEDMWAHITDIIDVVAPAGTVHYVVGNSRFYDTIVPVEQMFADMLTEAGFQDARIRRIRKRNSKKELFEFDVMAKR